jgi:hypothetical protein
MTMRPQNRRLFARTPRTNHKAKAAAGRFL